jgi:hypothetical protein
VEKDERLEDLCNVYNELNIKEKKKMEKIAVRAFIIQMSKDKFSIENKEDTELKNEFEI